MCCRCIFAAPLTSYKKLKWLAVTCIPSSVGLFINILDSRISRNSTVQTSLCFNHQTSLHDWSRVIFILNCFMRLWEKNYYSQYQLVSPFYKWSIHAGACLFHSDHAWNKMASKERLSTWMSGMDGTSLHLLTCKNGLLELWPYPTMYITVL